MTAEPTPTDLHQRFNEIVSASGLDTLTISDVPAPPFHVGCYSGTNVAPGSDAPLLARLSGMAVALADTPDGVHIRERLTALLTTEFPPPDQDQVVAGSDR